MSDRSCQICLQPLQSGEMDIHPACCKKLFGSLQPPAFPYTWDQLNELAGKVIRQHVTVPGVQPKLSMHLERSGKSRTSRLTLVGLAGDYILKPPVALYPEMPELEHLTLCMARSFGIETEECGLLSMEDGQRVFITRRMDRTQGGAKLHMEDLCQLTDRMTEQKYRGSMEQVGRAVLRYCTNPLFDALRLFELTVFCFLTGNADMHLKNFSVLYAPDDEIRLAPAYDLLPTVLLLPEDQEETALTLNGRKSKLEYSDFLQFGAALHLTERQIENVLAKLKERLDTGLTFIDQGLCSAEIKMRYRDLVLERATRCQLR
jgi:serine/threonine-protein kinase HipA